MSTEGPPRQLEEPLPGPSPPRVPTPIIDQDDLGRSFLEQAFQRVLVVLLLTQTTLVLYYTGMLEFILERSFRFCELEAGDSPYCYTFISILFPLDPSTSIFAIFALFTLDHHLSISPVFKRLKAYPGTSSGVTTTADDEDSPSTPLSHTHLPRDNEGSARCHTSVVLRILTISAYTLGAIWAAACLTALIDAVLTIHHWDEMPDEADALFKAKVCMVFVEVFYGALIVYFLFTIARLCSRARDTRRGGVVQTLPITTEDRGSASPSSRPLSMDNVWNTIQRFSLEELWGRRSILDKIILSLLTSLALSTVLSIYYLFFAPWFDSSHGRRYFLLYMITFLLTWATLYKYQSYRSNDVLPSRAFYVLTSGVACLLALPWVLDGVYLILLSLFSFLSDPRVLSLLQASALGGAALLSWRARGGIRLPEDDDEEQGAANREGDDIP